MGDASLSITNSRTGATKNFEANSKEAVNKSVWQKIFGNDRSDDYNVPLNVGGDRTIYLRPDQVDAIRMAAIGGGTRADIDMETGERKAQGTITVTVGGESFNLNTQDVINQLQGRGRFG